MIIQQATTTCLLALLISSRHSERELLEAARNDFFNEYKNEVRPAGSYDRYLFSMDEANHNEPSLTVPRARFNDDTQHTHAVLSDLNIPYSSYTILFVLTVIYSYLHRRCTVRELCAHWKIAPSTLYNWIHRLERDGKSWQLILKKTAKTADDLRSSLGSTIHAKALPFLFLKSCGTPYLAGSDQREHLLTLPGRQTICLLP